MNMEAFGLLKLLQTALSPLAEPTSSAPTEPNPAPDSEEPFPSNQEKSNAFLDLVKRHDEISKHIPRKK
ncbi:MAG: hypothetical protein IIX01_06205 [Clostridia bacterium]|nr:hypothetical protein [Clostridia bacterium]